MRNLPVAQHSALPYFHAPLLALFLTYPEEASVLQVPNLGNNPFAVLTAIVAPAILTNASSVLALGTSNRLGRVVDRTRAVATEISHLKPGTPEHAERLTLLDPLHARAEMLLKALRMFYAALGLFAASALVSVGGSVAAFYGQKFMFEGAAALAVATGASAVVGLSIGCTLMVHETRLAVRSLTPRSQYAHQGIHPRTAHLASTGFSGTIRSLQL